MHILFFVLCSFLFTFPLDVQKQNSSNLTHVIKFAFMIDHHGVFREYCAMAYVSHSYRLWCKYMAEVQGISSVRSSNLIKIQNGLNCCIGFLYGNNLCHGQQTFCCKVLRYAFYIEIVLKKSLLRNFCFKLRRKTYMLENCMKMSDKKVWFIIFLCCIVYLKN